MRFLKFHAEGFRRFADRHSLDLDERTIAIVGSNEAGKSSLLDGLLILLGDEEVAGSDQSRASDAAPLRLEGLFRLDEEDLVRLSEVEGCAEATHMRMTVTASSRQRQLLPEPRRDLAPRHACLEKVETIQHDPWLDPQFSPDGDLSWDAVRLADVLDVLASDDDTLTKEAVVSFIGLAERLEAIQPVGSEEIRLDESDPSLRSPEEEVREARIVDLAAQLRDLGPIERQPHPNTTGVHSIEAAVPRAVKFEKADRELLGRYDLIEIGDEIPHALWNLCELAALDMDQLRAAIDADDGPKLELLIERANRTLKERFLAAWSQANVYPRLSTPSAGVLHLFVRTENNEYSEFSERSDGLRTFIALQAFVANQGPEKPILLIDEAETHLHYDAQADLVDVLMRQDFAQKVVYTTHSVGCLPPDLGSGLRAVLPAGKERSSISNSYWAIDPGEFKVGYGPLLTAMGANMLALTTPRFGIIVEGPSDAILMPALLREAADLESLSFRVVPGLAEIAPEATSVLASQAGVIGYLADGDPDGLGYLDMLRTGGVPEELLFSLSEIHEGCTLEDLVAGEDLIEAITGELKTWSLGALDLDTKDLPVADRWNWIADQARRASIDFERVSKVRVAQKIAEISKLRSSSDDSLGVLAPEYHDSMKILCERISNAVCNPK